MGLFGFSYISKCNRSRSAPATQFSAVHTTEISIHWHLMGLGWNFMIFWHTREHPTAHLYCEKKSLKTKTSHQSAVHTPEIGVEWHLMGLCQNDMIFWHVREHPTGHLYRQKKMLKKKTSYQSAVHTTEIGIDWHCMGLCQNVMIFWHMREHPMGHLIAGKQNCAKKKLVVQSQILVQNILYHYLVVLNIKIRNCFLGTLPALGTVRGS